MGTSSRLFGGVPLRGLVSSETCLFGGSRARQLRDILRWSAVGSNFPPGKGRAEQRSRKSAGVLSKRGPRAEFASDVARNRRGYRWARSHQRDPGSNCKGASGPERGARFLRGETSEGESLDTAAARNKAANVEHAETAEELGKLVSGSGRRLRTAFFERQPARPFGGELGKRSGGESSSGGASTWGRPQGLARRTS